MQIKTTNTGMRRVGTLAGVAALAMLAAGCSSSRFGGAELAATAPLTPAPTGAVQTGQLAPPTVTASGPGAEATDPNQPTDPNQLPGTEGPVEVAAIDPVQETTATAPATGGGQPISENALIGNWSTSVGGSSCATFFGLTDLGSGLLGGTRGCSGDLAKFRTWKVAGNSATLRDAQGGTVATLTRTGDKSFSGTTSGGQAFTLTR